MVALCAHSTRIKDNGSCEYSLQALWIYISSSFWRWSPLGDCATVHDAPDWRMHVVTSPHEWLQSPGQHSFFLSLRLRGACSRTYFPSVGPQEKHCGVEFRTFSRSEVFWVDLAQSQKNLEHHVLLIVHGRRGRSLPAPYVTGCSFTITEACTYIWLPLVQKWLVIPGSLGLPERGSPVI
jgi:hypothetical protein